jgi:putative membrane protein
MINVRLSHGGVCFWRAPRTTADFVKEVVTSDMFELESNKLAQDRGNPPEKNFASKARQAQGRERQGIQFGFRFDAAQRAQGAVSLFQRYAKGREDPNLRNWTAKTLPALKHHLEMAHNLKKSK